MGGATASDVAQRAKAEAIPIAPLRTRSKPMGFASALPILPATLASVIPRACGVSSTPRPFASISRAGGILDHPHARVMTIGELAWVSPSAAFAAGRVLARNSPRLYDALQES